MLSGISIICKTQEYGYACTWLPWVCSDLGHFDEGLGFGERAQEIAQLFPADQYLFYKSLGGLSKTLLPLIFLLGGQYSESEVVSEYVIEFCEKRGLGYMSEIAYLLYS